MACEIRMFPFTDCSKSVMISYIYFADSAVCHPACLYGGTCVSPGVCQCTPERTGDHCQNGTVTRLT